MNLSTVSGQLQEGKPTSQVFRPTPKDENRLSVDNGDMISAEAAYVRFCARPGCSSVGVMAVSKEECDCHALPLHEDADPYPEHCSIVFEGLSKHQVEKVAKHLRRYAEERGWQLGPNNG